MQSDACSGSHSCEMETTRMEVMRYWQPPFTSSECSRGQYKVGIDAPSQITGTGNEALLGFLGFLTGGIFDWFANSVSDCIVDVTGKSYRMMSSDLTHAETRPFERDWEIFVPGQNAQAALQIAKDYFQQNGLCLPLIGVFIRFAPPEDGTLIAHTVNEGPFAQGSPGMFFEIPVFLPKGISCGNLARYEKVFADLAERMVSAPIYGRAHWAKNRRSLFQLQRRLGTYGTNMKQFRDTVKLMDPTGMFANQFGVDIGLRWPQLSSDIPSDTEAASCSADP
jgi:hypothetical protein